jgi:SNF2 family DNA or RNA helicase
MVEEWLVALEAEEDEEIEREDADLEATSRLAQATRLAQITSNLCNLEKGAGKAMPRSSAKEDLLVDLIRQGDIEFPLLVWTWFKPTTESLDARLEKEFGKDLRITYVHGGLTAEQKDLGIEQYKDGEVDVLILQMGVGKFGHNLIDTKTVFYHDRSYESDAYIQSLRRVKRIGLTHRPRLIIPRAQISADPLIELNLAGKMTSISKVASHDLRELLKSLGAQEWAMEDYNTGIEE